MGVYYIIVNDSKKEYVDPFDFEDNFKLSGTFSGLHGYGVTEMLVHPVSDRKYGFGYWCGDSIRVLGDDKEDEMENIEKTYKNISHFVLANVFENCHAYRDEILRRASENPKILNGLKSANEQFNYVNLKYGLTRLNEQKT